MNEEPLRDILPPVLLPEEPNYLLIVAVVLACLFCCALLLWFFTFRKKKVLLPAAHETALAELLQLRSLMVREQAAHYAAKLSSVLRRYIENRFQIPTSRQTTKEFFAELQLQPAVAVQYLEQHAESLQTCLDQCDMAKFARQIPEQQAMEHMEEAVQQFVEATRESGKGES